MNDAPVAVNDDTDSVNENETVTKTGSQNDVLNDDTDTDTSALSLTVSNISHTNGELTGSVSSSSTYNSSGTQIVGTYGTLTIGRRWLLYIHS